MIDDIADDPGASVAERQAALDLWKQALAQPVAGESALAPPVRALIAKYRLPVAHFLEIIAGVEMDLAGASYATWDDLRLYCHRVASVVGLVSIEIFGCRDPGARRYAEQLGLALQLTNILRDVGQDFANGGRIYLPREDLDALWLHRRRPRRRSPQRCLPRADAFRGGARSRLLPRRGGRAPARRSPRADRRGDHARHLLPPARRAWSAMASTFSPSATR